MRLPSIVQGLDGSLWTKSLLRRRSRACTPLYVERYRAPRLRPHLTSHAFWEFTCALHGQGHIVGHRDYPLAANDVCLIPPRYRHDERAAEPLETIWLGFLTSHRLPWREPVVVRSGPLRQQLEALWLLTQNRGEPIGPELDAATAGVLALFLRLTATGQPGDAGLMDQAVQHLQRQFREPLFVADLARRFGCSAGHFHRLFKQHTGETPMRFVARLRVQQARRLLELTDLSITDVARQVGFDDPLYFSRVCRRLTGRPPSAWQRHTARPSG